MCAFLHSGYSLLLLDFVRFCDTCCCCGFFAHLLLLHAAQLTRSAKRLTAIYSENTYIHIYVHTYILKYRWVCLYVYIHYTHRHKPESESDSKIAAGSGAWQLAGLAKTKCLNKWPATSGYINSQHCRRRQSARLATNASIHTHTYKQTYYVYICVYACLLTVCVCVRFACASWVQFSSLSFFLAFAM